MRNRNKIKYVGIDIQLHSCVDKGRSNIDKLIQDIDQFIRNKLQPLDFDSDVEVSLSEYTASTTPIIIRESK